MTSVELSQALGAPRREIGASLLGVPEDQWFDRKSARIAPRELANALIGMANAEGGTIAVGLSDGGIEGTDGDTKRRNDQIQAPIDFILPAARIRHGLLPCVNDEGVEDHLLLFEVDPSDVVHENRRDEVYLRVGDETRRLSFGQRQELLYDKGQANYEVRVLSATVDDLDSAPLLAYAEAVGASDPLRLLQARGLAKDRSLTVAGALLFARDPQELFPEAYVRVLRYRGTERGAGASQQLVADKRCEGPIPKQLVDAREAILELQPTRRALMEGGRFGDIGLIPEDVWLEGLVNAVVHRSYSLGGDHIRVDVFDDRIEISSPGRFPGIVDLSDPLHAVRFARNPRIARVCADQHFGFGQELGEGIRRMFAEMREARLTDPLYRQTSGSVELTLLAEPADRALEERLPAEARVVTSALRASDRLSTGEIAELLGISRPAAIRRLRMLEGEGLIEWVGKSPNDPRAYWRLG